MEPIKFYIGEENGIVVENSEDRFENSLFREQYNHVFRILSSIWEDKTPISNCGRVKNENSSNIIAICGDRGEGKTSLLYSVCDILRDSRSYDAARTVGLFLDDVPNFAEKSLVIDVIDPSYFDDKHNIIELLLGQMYAKLIEEGRKSNQYAPCGQEDVSALLKQFNKVKSGLSILKKEKEKSVYDNLEEIDSLATGIALRGQIDELFRLYARHFGKERLIFGIDDLDLNISEGYELAEQIRKYLSTSKYCVLLIAVKVDQLVKVIASNLRKQIADPIVSVQEVEEMAIRYVKKLLPYGNRVSVPKVDNICNRELIVARRTNVSDSKIEIQESGLLVKEYIVRLIFRKTGYVFYNAQSISPIVPRNLRAMRHLIGSLYPMPDFKDEDDNDVEDGRKFFDAYFFNTWTNILDKKDRSFVMSLQDIDASFLNKTVIDYLASKLQEYDKTVEDWFRKNRLLYEICKPSCSAVNISVGDVLYTLWLLDKEECNENFRNLIFFLKSYYSMKLYAAYNQISEGAEYLYPKEQSAQISIFKRDEIYTHVNDLQLVVNGAMFTYPQGSLLSRQKLSKRYVDLGYIKLDTMKTYLEDIRDPKKSSFTLAKLHCCEFIALCTRNFAMYEDVEKPIIGANRDWTSPTYLGVLSEYKNFLMIDFLAPFTNLINVRQAYERFSGLERDFDLYKIADAEPQSLLNKMREASYKERFEKKPVRNTPLWDRDKTMLSCSVIRLVDVQWAILDLLTFKKNNERHKSDSNQTEKYKEAYNDIINLKMSIYRRPFKRTDKNKDIQVNDGLFELNFAFLNVLRDYLGSKDVKDLQDVLSEYLTKDEELRVHQDQFKEGLPAVLMLLSKITSYSLGKRGGLLSRQMQRNSRLTGIQDQLFKQIIKDSLDDEKIYETEDDLIDLMKYRSELMGLGAMYVMQMQSVVSDKEIKKKRPQKKQKEDPKEPEAIKDEVTSTTKTPLADESETNEAEKAK